MIKSLYSWDSEIMFTELNEEEFVTFLESCACKNFLQTPAMGKFRTYSNWQYVFVGIKDNDKVLCACMLTYRNTRFGREFYSVRGLLIDYKDYNLLKQFTEELKKYVKMKKGYILRIDPYIMLKERDRDGKIVEGGIDNTYVRENLLKLGYKLVPLKKPTDNKQANFIYTINIKDKTLDDIMKDMDSKTRQMIRKNEKLGIVIREAKYEDLSLFSDIMKDTATSKNFTIHNLEYFQNLYNCCKKENIFKLIIAELNIDLMINNLKKELQELDNDIELRKSKFANGNIQMSLKKLELRLKEDTDNINRIKKKIKEAIKLQEEKGKVIPLGGIIYFIFGNEVLSLHGGTYREYIKWQPFYTINYEMIKFAIDNKYDIYNFYGISNVLDENDDQYGIYLFKKGFGGQVVELVGEYILPINYKYRIQETIDKLKKH